MPNPRILLIEDDPSVRHGIAAFLRANDLDVDEAEACAQALDLFRAGKHDVVVADYSLPDGTSLDILPQVKRISEDTPESSTPRSFRKAAASSGARSISSDSIRALMGTYAASWWARTNSATFPTNGLAATPARSPSATLQA